MSFDEIFRVYSGTVAGAREAFFNGIPAVSVSYNWYALVTFPIYLFFHAESSSILPCVFVLRALVHFLKLMFLDRF